MPVPFCPGYAREPFATLVANHPDGDVHPLKDFRVEWWPVFHRGRLDGSARYLSSGKTRPSTRFACVESLSDNIVVGAGLAPAAGQVEGICRPLLRSLRGPVRPLAPRLLSCERGPLRA